MNERDKLIRAMKLSPSLTHDGETWKDDKFVALVNEANFKHRFCYVTNGYKIAQHEDVISIIEEALKDLKFNHTMTFDIMNDGCRINVKINFPDVKLDLLSELGEMLYMRISTDNSYDCTTGLRFQLGAYTGGNIRLHLSDKFSKHYHKHTKGLDITDVEKALTDGVKNFQEKVKNVFLALVDSPLNPAQVTLFLDDCIKRKVQGVAKKYLEAPKTEIKKGNIVVKNKWNLYHLMCKVASDLNASVDVERTVSLNMLREVKKLQFLNSDQVTHVIKESKSQDQSPILYS